MRQRSIQRERQPHLLNGKDERIFKINTNKSEINQIKNCQLFSGQDKVQSSKFLRSLWTMVYGPWFI